MEPNPYAAPGYTFANGVRLAKRYRVDHSKVSLREFHNLSRSRVVGTIYWCALKLGVVRSRQIIDAPKPFLEDTCDPHALPAPIHEFLYETASRATALGFHSARPSMAHSTGIEVTSGALWMLHESRSMFLSIVAGAAGEVMLRESVIVSAAADEERIEVFASSNFGPKFTRPSGVQARYYPQADLEDLFREHQQWMGSLAVPWRSFASFRDVAVVMDHLSVVHLTSQLERGVLVPVA